MTYQQTLDYLYTSLPMYHRVGAAAYKADITNTVQLMAHLGNPERQFQSIHVAGTNGKGSVSHMLASILQEAGYKVGLYTSPHLVDFRERIRVNGEMVPQEEVVRFVEQHRAFMEPLGLSFFEMTVGLAFDYFARQQVDIAVVEVGMGGRLDSTNVITPLLSVITNIGLDHTQFLGDTLEKIAVEKAGIIKQGVPVVIGQFQPETQPVFEAIAAERKAPLSVASRHWRVCLYPPIPTSFPTPPTLHPSRRPPYYPFTLLRDGRIVGNYMCGLGGSYQQWNIATVCEAVEQLRHLKGEKVNRQGACGIGLVISKEAFRRGLRHVVDNTHLQGRWQVIGLGPLTICETAHNFDGINAMLQGLKDVHFRRLHLIYGCVNDKDFHSILAYLKAQLSQHAVPCTWYLSQPSVPRGLPVATLAEAARSIGINAETFPDVKEAINAARCAAAADDLVLVTGSIFLVADALAN